MLSASLEDYLEAIYHISEEKRAAKSKDISARLGVNKSSVTGALKALSKRGLVNYAPYDIITLTPEGLAGAESITRRHEVFSEFLESILGVGQEEAERNACRVEHALSSDIVNRLRQFMEFLDERPRARKNLIDGFRHYLETS
jgi:DtxR family Mn-dependent transcriptional regulator